MQTRVQLHSLQLNGTKNIIIVLRLFGFLYIYILGFFFLVFFLHDASWCVPHQKKKKIS